MEGSARALALLVIAIGGVEATIGAVRLLLRRHASKAERRALWLVFARRLVAGLTFQLAADIIGTSIAPTWQEVGQLGAIAVIRTFLNYFLERDLTELSERDATPASTNPADRG